MLEQHPRDPYLQAKYDQGVDAKIVIMGNTGLSSSPRVPRVPLALRSAHFLVLAPGVGKTSLLHRYTQNKFEPKNTTSTTGAFFVTKKVHVHGIKVRLQLWDTAGQERFRSMASLFPFPRRHLRHPSG